MAYNRVDEWSGTKVIATVAEEVLPCTSGQTKCIGPDLYKCSGAGQWVLEERNASQCAEKAFPWLWVIGGLSLGALILLPKKRVDRGVKK